MKKPIFLLCLLFVSITSFSQINYTPLYDSISFAQKVVDVSKPVGGTAGFADVTNNGSATYTIPIWSLPGSGGVTPQIALVYNSQSGNGIAGMGWSISGLSSITRVGKDLLHDGEVSPVTYSSDDKYALDGVRLVYKSGTYGQPNAEYALETEDFSHITSYGAIGSGPESFFVRKKDGTLLQYGNTSDSRFVTNDGQNVMTYCLNKIVDINGNYIEFVYSFEGRSPRIVSINYTGNTYENILPYNRITFSYSPRIDQNTTYEGGSFISTGFLLDMVSVIDENNTTQKLYQLRYGNDGIASYLKEIIEKDRLGNELNSTAFKYGNIPNGFSTENITIPNTLDYNMFSADIEGDGIAELITPKRQAIGTGPSLQFEENGFRIYTRTSGTSNFVETHDEPFPTTHNTIKYTRKNIEARPNNFYTSDKFSWSFKQNEDLLAIEVGINPNNNFATLNSLQGYKSAGSGTMASFSSTSFNPNQYGIDPDHHCFFTGDFDGDGFSDIFSALTSNSNPNGSYFPGNEAPYMINYNGQVRTVTNINSTIITDYKKAMVIDFDGDGKSELLFLTQSKYYVFSFEKQVGSGGYTLYSSTLLNSGTYPNASCKEIYLADFNNDRKTDLLILDQNLTNIYKAVSSGTSFSTTNFLISPTPVSYSSILLGDYNGDSFSDVIIASSAGSGYNLGVYYSRGNDFYQQNFSIDRLNNTATGDFNGDGRTDVFDYSLGSTFYRRIFSFRRNGKENLLEKVSDGFGNVVKFNYEPLTSSVNYTKGNSASLPMIDFQGSMYVVRNMETLAGGTLKQVNYKYESAVIHKRGRGFLGFKKIIAEIPISNARTETINEIDPVTFIPYVKERNTYNTQTNQQISHTTSNIAFVQGTVPGSYYQQLLSQTEQNLLTGTTSTTTNTYDNNNFGTIVSSVTDINGLEIITTTTTYTQQGSTTVPCLPELVTVTRQRSGQPAATDKTYITYDWAGRVYQKIEKYQTPYYLATTLQYDNFGNVTQTEDYNLPQSGSNPTTIYNYYTYDNKGRFKESFTNAFGQTSNTTWDPVWGKPLTLTGIDGVTTVNTYDSWGRLTTTKLKQGTAGEETITRSYGWDISGNQLYYVLTSHPNKPDVKVWYDKLGREVKARAEHVSGQWTERTKSYDAKGNLLTETAPKLSSEPTFTTTYAHNDVYNRLTSVTNNFGTTTYSYNLLGNGEIKTTMTNAAGRPKSITTDATGKTIVQEDDGGKLTYSYDSRGNLLTTKLGPAILTSHTYNQHGIKTNTYDNSAGVIAYSYDAFGRLKSEKDAKGQTHSFLYNELGLITQRTGPEGTTYYDYYGAGGGYANQLATVTGFNGVNESYDYDEFGRLIHEEKYIDGNTYSTHYSYDTDDNLIKKEYSNGFYLDYLYVNGFLQAVLQPNGFNAPTQLFLANSMNGLGQFTQYELLNGIATTNTYHHGYLTRTTAFGKQDLEMGYDYTNGNLLFREDHIKNLREDFQYDDLERLTESFVNSSQYPPVQIDYDVNGLGQSRGNIISKSDIGTFGTSIAGRTHSSLNEESIIRRQTQDITYTPFRKAQSVTELDTVTGILYEQIFTYDASYNRVKTELWDKTGNVLLNTRLYLGEYEINIDPNTQDYNYVHYINGGDGLCAIAEIQNQFNAVNNNITYHVVYKDHLGSIVTTTDEDGWVEAEQSFDAWGRERDPGTWEYNGAIPVGLTQYASWLYRGYTGHEHMPHFTVINMNGRMYDPVLGRMMSPDPYIMGGTQGYNRYSYCLNNPLKYTDPSGNYILPWIAPNISWSNSGNLDIGLSVGVGWGGPNGVGVFASVGYTFKEKNFHASVGAYAAIASASVTYGSKSGWSAYAGVGFGAGGMSWGSMSAGVGWSQYGGFSANIAGYVYSSATGWGYEWSMGYSYGLGLVIKFKPAYVASLSGIAAMWDFASGGSFALVPLQEVTVIARRPRDVYVDPAYAPWNPRFNFNPFRKARTYQKGGAILTSSTRYKGNDADLWSSKAKNISGYIDMDEFPIPDGGGAIDNFWWDVTKWAEFVDGNRKLINAAEKAMDLMQVTYHEGGGIGFDNVTDTNLRNQIQQQYYDSLFNNK